jgi:Nitrile hydratase, alpha chain
VRKSAAYRSRAVIDPRGVLREFGTEVDEDVEVRVWDSTAELRYIVLPERPAGTASAQSCRSNSPPPTSFNWRWQTACYSVALYIPILRVRTSVLELRFTESNWAIQTSRTFCKRHLEKPCPEPQEWNTPRFTSADSRGGT